MRNAFAAVCLCFAGVGITGVAASQPYPIKAIRFIVPFSPGGGTDLVARIVGQKFNEAWGQPVVIDNRPGAGSTVGTALAVNAPADGYTILMSSISLAFEATLYKTLPYDPVRHLAPVSLVASQPNMVVVSPALPVKSVK